MSSSKNITTTTAGHHIQADARNGYPTDERRAAEMPQPQIDLYSATGTSPPPAAHPRMWFTAEEAAEMTGVSARTLQRWARERKIPHLRIGRTLRFTHDHLAVAQSTYTTLPAPSPVAALPNPDFHPYIRAVDMERPDTSS